MSRAAQDRGHSQVTLDRVNIGLQQLTWLVIAAGVLLRGRVRVVKLPLQKIVILSGRMDA